MPPCSQLWQQIREHPGLYLGSASITALYHFLGGWSTALERHAIVDDSLHVPMDFHEWVAYRERFNESTPGWCRMLLDRCGSEEAALQRFFVLHDEYVARVPREFAHVESLSRYSEREVNGQWKRIGHTGRLSLITYTDDPGFFEHFDAPDWGIRDEFHPGSGRWLMFASTASHALTISDRSEYDRVMKEIAT